MSGCDENAATELEIMWTNQHGTGSKTDDRVETQVILQYMCQPYPKGVDNDINKDFALHTIRNGEIIKSQVFTKDIMKEKTIRENLARGLHEPNEYYHAFVRRERNEGKITQSRKSVYT